MRENGVIEWYIHEKGFGFIKVKDEEELVLVHHKDVKRKDETQFKSGLTVSFERFMNRAINVRPS